MGTIKTGILGGFSGRVGTVVGATWNSVHYMRALATSVKNPRTDKQLSQRTKFAKTLAFLRAITPYVRIGYAGYAKKQTAFNAAKSYIVRKALSGSGLDIAIDYRKVLVSRGPLMQVFNASVQVSDGEATFNWDDNTGMGDAAATDVAMPLVYNKALGEAYYLTASVTRAEETLTLTLPAGWADAPLAVYLGFRSEDGRQVANSLCLKSDAYEGDAGDAGSSGNTGGSDNTGSGGSGSDGNTDDNPLG